MTPTSPNGGRCRRCLLAPVLALTVSALLGAPAAQAVVVAGTGVVLPGDVPASWPPLADVLIQGDTVTVEPLDQFQLRSLELNDNGVLPGVLELQGGTVQVVDEARVGLLGTGELRLTGNNALLVTPLLRLGVGDALNGGDGTLLVDHVGAVLRGNATALTTEGPLGSGFRLDMVVGGGDGTAGMVDVRAGSVIASQVAVGADGPGTGTVSIAGNDARLFLTPDGNSALGIAPGAVTVGGVLGGLDGGGGTLAVENGGGVWSTDVSGRASARVLNIEGSAAAPSQVIVRGTGSRFDSFSSGGNDLAINGADAGSAALVVSDGGVLGLNRTNEAIAGGLPTSATLFVADVTGMHAALEATRGGSVYALADAAQLFIATDAAGDGGTSASVRVTDGGSLSLFGSHTARLVGGGSRVTAPENPVLLVDGANSVLQLGADGGGGTAGTATLDFSPQAGSMTVSNGALVTVAGRDVSRLALGKVAGAGAAQVRASTVRVGGPGSRESVFEHHGGAVVLDAANLVVEAANPGVGGDSATFRSTGSGLQVYNSAVEVRGGSSARLVTGTDGVTTLADPLFIGNGITTVTATGSALIELGAPAATPGNASTSAVWLSGASSRTRVQGATAALDVGTSGSAGSAARLRIDGGAQMEVLGGNSARARIGTVAGSSGEAVVAGAGSLLRVRDAGLGNAELILGNAAGTGSGRLRLEGGRVEAGRLLVYAGGRVEGSGRLAVAQRTVVSGGYVAPGLSPGRLEVDGDFWFEAGVLDIEVAGLGAGEYDVLDVGGDVTLAGGLVRLSFVGGFVPSLGDIVSFLLVGGALDVSPAVRFQVAGLPSGLDLRFGATAAGFGLSTVQRAASGVPEPGTLALAAGVMLLGGSCGRLARRRRAATRPG